MMDDAYAAALVAETGDRTDCITRATVFDDECFLGYRCKTPIPEWPQGFFLRDLRDFLESSNSFRHKIIAVYVEKVNNE